MRQKRIGVLDPAERRQSAASIIAAQGSSGMIPWWQDGPGDPWNHVEAAIALDAVGEHEAARGALVFLAEHQRDDGAFFSSYDAKGSVLDERIDTNQCAYVATGVLHHLHATRDVAFARVMWPVVDRSIAFVLRAMRSDGTIAWSIDANGEAADAALLSGSSSIFQSIRCALLLAGVLGKCRPHWQSSILRLGAAIRGEGRFLEKDEYAMDWYYPVLSGALDEERSRQRLIARASKFIARDGVRCRSDRRWRTTAETAECSACLSLLGFPSSARALLSTTADKRQDDGSYLTGLVYPERRPFPSGEVTTYSTAAVLLADELLAGGAASSAVFARPPRTRTSTRRLPVRSSHSSSNSPELVASR